ncbi:phage major capsid protein [Pikeienuella sp. HZG-20]|uniref:phage major capsid protein n=1 Tax=Paludibacillus litoralis TaxID=3133267 RepID=UPI0030EB2B50
MTHEAQAATGPEVKSSLSGFLNDFKSFQTEIKSRMTEQEERIGILTRKSAHRPPLSGAAEMVAPHRKAMDTYLRAGDDAQLRALQLDGKSLTTGVLADGGYLVDPQTSDRIMGVLRASSSIRSVATVAAVEAGVYDVLVDHTDVGAGWTAESGAVAETDTPQIERISITLHELSASPKASQRLLDDSAFDIEAWLAERIADRFTRAENAAFVNGDGIDKPTGFLSYSALPNDNWTWGSLGYVATGTAGDFSSVDPSDAVVDLIYSLGAEYRVNATFVMNSKTAGAVRKMKDADGRFLWAESLASGQPARLMGYPVVISEDMPDIGADAMAVAFGDFGAGYTIAERPDMRVMRDPFSAKPHVLFYASKRVGGDVTDFAAIKLLKFATS